MRLAGLLKESVRSSVIASLAMMAVGFLLTVLGARVGYYGPKFAAFLFGESTPMILFVQHFVIGWISTLPFLLILRWLNRVSAPLVIGVAYGGAYYGFVNSFALPLFFGERTPWEIGVDVIYPSLLVHLVFGASIGFTARRWLAREVALPHQSDGAAASPRYSD
jgi:uncharacterized membrane protein YagU involved in acid resistance